MPPDDSISTPGAFALRISATASRVRSGEVVEHDAVYSCGYCLPDFFGIAHLDFYAEVFVEFLQ